MIIMKKNKIEIYINGKKKILDNDCSILEVLKIFNIKNRLIAIEVNKEIIPKSQYKIKKIMQNDKIEIVELIGGG